MAKLARPKSLQSARTIASQKAEAANRKLFLALCARAGLPVPETEFHFAKPERNHRFDFAWPKRAIGLEVQGGVFSGGKHGRASGIIRDMLKANLAASRGWCVFYVTPKELTAPATIDMLRAALTASPRVA